MNWGGVMEKTDLDMEEHDESKSSPFPKMDINFLRDEWHSRGGARYYSDIITRIHYLVRYKCCFCGVENRDDDQFFELMKHIDAADPQTRVEKEEQIVRNIKYQAGKDAARKRKELIYARSYYRLGLNCRCAQCAKKQPWSDFKPISEVFEWIKRIRREWTMYSFTWFMILVIVFLPMAFSRLYAALPLVAIAVLVALFIPSLAAMVHNWHTQKKSLELEEEYRPEITIVYLSENEARRIGYDNKQ